MTSLSINVEVSNQKIQDLLISAFEGGSNYWIELIDQHKTAFLKQSSKTEISEYLSKKAKEIGIDYDSQVSLKYVLPFLDDCFLKIQTIDGAVNILNMETILRGLTLMANTPNLSRHFGNIISGDDDAETADVFLQLACFGALIYG